MPLVLDPVNFQAASSVFGQAAYAVADAASARRDFPGMAGDDPIGRSWGEGYDDAARRLVASTEAVVNGCFRLAGLLEQTGFNYAVAEASSTPRALWHHQIDRTQWASTSVALPPPAPAAGPGSSGPTGWSLITDAVGELWPNGHQDRLRSAAAAWDEAASAVRAATAGTWAAEASVLDVSTPEAPAAEAACRSMRRHLDEIADAHGALAQACRDYAQRLDETHAAIISELEDLLAWTIAIEAGGAVLSVITVGIAEAPTQAVEAGRIAATAARVGALIRGLAAAAEGLRAGLAAAAERAATVLSDLHPLLSAQVSVAGVTMVRASEVGGFAGRAAQAEARAEAALSMAAMSRRDIAAMSGLTQAERALALQRLAVMYRNREGDYFIGRLTREDADVLGRAWVGPGAYWSKNGRALISRDNLRQYRLPLFKDRRKVLEANLERRHVPDGSWPHNGHIQILRG